MFSVCRALPCAVWSWSSTALCCLVNARALPCVVWSYSRTAVCCLGKLLSAHLRAPFLYCFLEAPEYFPEYVIYGCACFPLPISCLSLHLNSHFSVLSYHHTSDGLWAVTACHTPLLYQTAPPPPPPASLSTSFPYLPPSRAYLQLLPSTRS